VSQSIKVVVSGAAGQIGYALLFRIASGAVFGSDVSINLRLLEVEGAMPAVEGVIMELDDCAFPLLHSVEATSNANVAMKDANAVVLVGAFPRQKGMERADLLEKNAAIFKVQGKAINDHAASNVKVLVVGNPCNTNALIAMTHAPDISNSQFYAMTMLDENRACAQLAKKAGVDVADVNHMVIWGNHSATQYPDFYNATINGSSAADVINDTAWLEQEFIQTVQQRGAAVIAARGASSAASAANGIVDSLKALFHDTDPGQLFSMCCCSKGEYGVDAGLIFSFPCRTENGKLRIIEGIEHNAFATEKLQATLDELRAEKDAVQQLDMLTVE